MHSKILYRIVVICFLIATANIYADIEFYNIGDNSWHNHQKRFLILEKT